jgi:Na+-transporting NADH:ubiquinone oxidoreductase subunit E
MCSYLAVSKSVKTALGLGIAVIFVLGITMPMNWLINEYLLKETGFFGMDLTFLRFILFIAVIAALVQLVEMVVEKFSPSLYNA